MCLSALFCGQKNILTFLRRASSKIEVKKNDFLFYFKKLSIDFILVEKN
jgi:hypothetical protein